jgi:O-glycosyl hydrolase/ankyrin repeat protein
MLFPHVALWVLLATNPPVTVTIDFRQNYQEIDGFGTSIINYKDFPEEYGDPDFIDRVVQDLGLSILRLPITEHLEYANDDDDPDHFNWSGFRTADNHRRKGLERTMELARAFRRAGVERFMMTPWSPPQFMKTNRAPIQGGFLRQDMTAEFAEYLAAVVLLAKYNYGIDVNWISIQNESIFIEFYRSCLYHPEMMREAVRAVMRKFAREGIQTEILLNEDMLFADRIIDGVLPTLSDPETATFDGHLAVHRKQGKEGLERLRDFIAPYGRKLWMTETSGHDANWAGAFRLANDMHEHLVYGNFSAWLYWQISGRTGSSDPGRYTLMSDGQPTKKYYASKHFYRYVRPGAVRIGATAHLAEDSLALSAFHHPIDGTLTVVAINNSATDRWVRLRGAGKQLPGTLEYHLTTEEVDWETRHLAGADEPIRVPAYAIVSLYGQQTDLRTAAARTLPPPVVADRKQAALPVDATPFPARIDWQLSSDGHPDLIEKAKRYLAAGNIDSARFNGWTLLHDAALNGDCAALRFLLANGANPAATARDGWTPTHAAAATFVGGPHAADERCTQRDVLAILLAAGPDLSARTQDGLTPLHAAVMNTNTAFRKDERDAVGKVTDLIEAGADVNATDTDGRTPLHWAAVQGYTHFTDNTLEVEADVVDALLGLGADPRRSDRFGYRPRDYARRMGYTSILARLLGEKPTAQTRSTDPAAGRYGPELLRAAWRGDRDEVNRLLGLGADTRYVDSDGFTARERARDNGHDRIVDLIQAHEQKN